MTPMLLSAGERAASAELYSTMAGWMPSTGKEGRAVQALCLYSIDWKALALLTQLWDCALQFSCATSQLPLSASHLSCAAEKRTVMLQGLQSLLPSHTGQLGLSPLGLLTLCDH